MALILSGVMLFQSVGFTQAADFSDGTIVEDSSINNDERENLPEDFTDDEMLNSFTDARVDTNNTIFDPAITDSSLNDDEETEELSVATAGEKTSGKCGDNAYWTFKEGTLSISGKGEMYDYSWDTDTCPPWNYLDEKIKTIVIMNRITRIGSWAFDYCDSLRVVRIPNSVTSIGTHAFTSCNSIKSITIPNSVTSIGTHAFERCKSLEKIAISNSVTQIKESTFERCEALKSITIPSHVTSIGQFAFEYCKSLKNIIIPDNIIYIGGGAFWACSSLKSITIPSSVKFIDRPRDGF